MSESLSLSHCMLLRDSDESFLVQSVCGIEPVKFQCSDALPLLSIFAVSSLRVLCVFYTLLFFLFSFSFFITRCHNLTNQKKDGWTPHKTSLNTFFPLSLSFSKDIDRFLSFFYSPVSLGYNSRILSMIQSFVFLLFFGVSSFPVDGVLFYFFLDFFFFFLLVVVSVVHSLNRCLVCDPRNLFSISLSLSFTLFTFLILTNFPN